MSAGDKDRSGFHRVGGSLTQARSRDSTQEHEHCTPDMLADRPGSSACGILGRASRRKNMWRNLNWLLLAGALAVGQLPHGIAHPLGAISTIQEGVIMVQGPPGWPGQPGGPGGPGWSPDQERLQNCAGLQHRAAEIQSQMANTPPWERRGMKDRLREVQQRLRHECRG
jgi:hypothetical protein